MFITDLWPFHGGIPRMEIQTNFLEDYRQWLVCQLRQFDPAIDPASGWDELCIRYENWRHRHIPAKPRTVHVAPGLQCPPALEVGFNALKEKIQRGDDLTPHLSTRITDLDFYDGLLDDWGIYHLHLGTNPHPRNPAFVERTAEVLMARFDEQNAYLIEIVPHGQWTRKRLLQIIHRNWPETIARYRIPGIVKLERDITEEEHARLRKGGVFVLVEIDGDAYVPPGGGLTTSGVGVKVVDCCARMVQTIRQYEDALRNNAAEVVMSFRQAATATQEGVSVDEPLVLKMHTDGNTAWAVAPDLSLVMTLGPLLS